MQTGVSCTRHEGEREMYKPCKREADVQGIMHKACKREVERQTERERGGGGGGSGGHG
jgi:hypothetical protein